MAETKAKIHHPLYHTWCGMRQRCYNPRAKSYKWYGAKGIAVCERWSGPNGFWNFVADMGPRPDGMTLDRHPNPKGNYEPDNCRWATPKEQAHNFSAGGHYNAVKQTCKRGHPWTHENIVWRPNGRRKCKLCLSIMNSAHYERNRGATVPKDKKRPERSHGLHRKVRASGQPGLS